MQILDIAAYGKAEPVAVVPLITVDMLLENECIWMESTHFLHDLRALVPMHQDAEISE